MVATAIYSVTMVLCKETAFPLCRAMERRWERNDVSWVYQIQDMDCLYDRAYGHDPWIDGF